MVNLESLLVVVAPVIYGIILVKSGWFIAWEIRRRAGSLQDCSSKLSAVDALQLPCQGPNKVTVGSCWCHDCHDTVTQ